MVSKSKNTIYQELSSSTENKIITQSFHKYINSHSANLMAYVEQDLWNVGGNYVFPQNSSKLVCFSSNLNDNISDQEQEHYL